MPYAPGDLLLDKYRIEVPLGQGAFGEVYLVTHLILDVSRALKVLKRDAPGIGSSDYSEAQARFQLEAQLGAKLNARVAHPHLLQVFDCILSEEMSVLEMEYASGGSLTARLQKASESGQVMTVEAALQVAAEVADGLAALHAHGGVHRDLKPSNILFDELGRARLADLGLAQVPGGPSLRSQLSQPKPHPGTPDYMSPEQEGSGKPLKPPSDIYALGLVLFEMLTGKLYTNQRPGTHAKTYRPDIPAWLDALIARMLSKEPEARPWDGAEAAGLLRKGGGGHGANSRVIGIVVISIFLVAMLGVFVFFALGSNLMNATPTSASMIATEAGIPTRSASTASEATSTPKVNSSKPLATSGMNVIEIAGTQTAVAIGVLPMSTASLSTPFSQVTSDPVSNPGTYVLHEGEQPYCLARRFNVNPQELLTLNGFSGNQYGYVGMTLSIPTTGNVFPGPRALLAHPTQYTVRAGDTIYSVACAFGDVDPLRIVSANGLSGSYQLTAGTIIQIP